MHNVPKWSDDLFGILCIKGLKRNTKSKVRLKKLRGIMTGYSNREEAILKQSRIHM